MRTHWLAPLIISLVLLVSAGSAGVAASNASADGIGYSDTTDTSDIASTTDDVTAQQAPPGNWELLIDDGQTSTGPTVGIDTISAQHTAETFYIKAEYHGDFNQEDEIDFAVFLDTDQQVLTGLNGDSSSYDRYNENMNDIGADYVAVAGLEGNGIWKWRNTDWDQTYRNFDYLDFDYISNTVIIGIDRSNVDSPSAVDIVTSDAKPSSSENWDWAPDENEGHLTYDFNTNTSSFDFGIELQQEATASVGEAATITAYPNNNAETPVSDTTLELLVDTNNDGQFTASEVVASQNLDFNAGEYRTVDLTYPNIQLESGDYAYQARISKDGQTTTSYTNGTLTVTGETDQPSEPGIVVEDSVDLNGSTVTIQGGDVSAIGVSGIPEGYYPVSDIGTGTLQEGDNGVIWQSGGNVSFTLTPPESAEAGDTVSFDVKLGSGDPVTVTLDVVEQTSPADLPDSISPSQYSAVAGNDDDITTFDLVDAIQGASDDGTYNGQEFSTFDFVDLIQYNSG